MINNEEKNTRMQYCLLERTLPLEITTELTLPDYQSEISRLLWVSPTVSAPERFVGNGKAELSGKLYLQVLYAGADGRLCCARQECGYTCSLPIESGVSAECEPVLLGEVLPDALISRVLGPRKLSVRCKMHAGLRLFAEKSIAPQLGSDAAKDPALCRLCDAESTERVLLGNTESFPLADCVEITDGTHLILARGNVFLPETACEADEVRCRGEVLVTLLLCKEEEGALPYTVVRRIPFEQSIPTPGANAACHALAYATVGEIDACVEEGHIDLVVPVSLQAQAVQQEPVLFCRDAFLPGHSATYRFRDEAFRVPVCCDNRNFSICAERPLADLGLGEELSLLDAIATPEIKLHTADNKTLLEGELCCHLLYQKGGELACSDATLPFRLLLDEVAQDMQLDCRLASLRVSCAHGTLRADAELQLAMHGCDLHTHRILSEADFQPLQEGKGDGHPEIYYPAKGETLWDVAKHYAIPPQALAERNGIYTEAPGSADSLAGKRVLLIR